MNTNKKPLKMYVLVRNDLEITYRGVQGVHAVAQIMLHYPELATTWNNETIVQLAVRNEKDLEYWVWKLQSKNKKYDFFREPDLNNQMTAVSCVDTGEIFKNLQLSK
jgi:hypothetical protein